MYENVDAYARGVCIHVDRFGGAPALSECTYCFRWYGRCVHIAFVATIHVARNAATVAVGHVNVFTIDQLHTKTQRSILLLYDRFFELIRRKE